MAIFLTQRFHLPFLGLGLVLCCHGPAWTGTAPDAPAPPAAGLDTQAVHHEYVNGNFETVIARLNGSVLAGGFGLVAACDLAHAADHARFGLPEVRVGVFPLMITVPLLRQVPERRLKEMAYLGETIGAEEAERWNVINRAVPASELDAAIEDVIAKLTLGAPGAIAAGKKALFAIGDLDRQAGLAFAERLIAELGGSVEAAEGRAAFGEKRRPAWTNI